MTEAAFDVAIAGGGPAGLATALQLARAGVSVAVLEPRTRHPRFGETLPPGCRPLLAQLGLLETFLGGKHARCEGTMSVWGSPEVHYTDYLLHPERHGWRIDRDALEGSLRGLAIEHGAVSIEESLRSVTRDGEWLVNDSIRAQVLADATGRGAIVVRQLGAHKLHSDQLVGVAGLFSPSAGVECDFPLSYPLIEACEDGWIYSSIAADGQLVVVAMTDSDLAHAARLHDESSWRRWIARAPHTSRRLTGSACVAAPIVASACSQRLDRVAGDRWLAIGDAATAFDPLSSLGIVKAFRSAIAAAEAIRCRLAGDESAFEQYSRDVINEYTQYLDTRSRYYAMETRWPDAPFWRRRASLAA